MNPHQKDLSARVDVLEHSVGKLEAGVNDLAKALYKFMDTVREQPRPIPFKEIIVTIAVTLGVFVTLAQGLQYWSDRNIAVLEYRLQSLEKAANK